MMRGFRLWTLVCLCLLTALSAMARPITREQAQRKAEKFLKTLKGSPVLTPVVSSKKLAPKHKASVSTNELYYVFNRGSKEGYVIVPGDDAIETMLGYTDEGEFDYQTIPDNMRYWLDRQAAYLQYLQSTPNAAPRKVPVHAKVEPMVTTKWNQGDPYNQECPMYFNLGRSITGCVATAMAQVLYYQRAKSVTETQADIPAYDANTEHETYGRLHVEGIPAGSPIDWDNMLDTYGSGATAKQKTAVAQLMHYCGVAVEMDYTNSSSGAYSSMVPEAFKKYFGYGSSVRYVYAGNYNDETWDALLYGELEEGRPFYLSGHNKDAGHAFVCDGYDGNHCFHINWGWGGSSDGYFLLNSLDPAVQGLGGSDAGYSQGEEAVIGCEPENYMDKSMPFVNANVKKICIENWDTDEDKQLSYGEAAAVTDIGDVFKGKRFADFTELYYFTGLTSLADSAFSGCTTLANIKLPKALRHIGKASFAGCSKLATLKLPDNLKSIDDGAFANCIKLNNLTLPSGLTAIADSCFAGCKAITTMELPLNVLSIGKNAFAGCTKLNTFNVQSVMPQKIVLGEAVFAEVALEAATLNTLQGNRAYFASADQWKDFGTIYEERTLSHGNFATLETKVPYYLYNVGLGYYLTRGEAYGTQAVVANTSSPMRFEFRATTTEGVCSLFSNDTGNSNHYLFRTTSDGSVGSGVKACFVDGATSKLSDRSAYWHVQLVEGTDNVYTLQIPSNREGYVETEFLGVQLDHESNYASPTYGVYSDISYTDLPLNCQWMLVPYNEQETALFETSQKLKNLLAIGKSRRADIEREQAIYDNSESTEAELQDAIIRLRKKLDFINFVDEVARPIFVSNLDLDGNGEISYSEAASAEDVGTYFSGNKSITDMTDLKYLTNAEYISGNAFMDCSKLKTVIVPEKVEDIYYQAFKNCTKLETVELPAHLSYIAEDAFTNCKALREVRISVPDPSSISTGSELFNKLDLSAAVLYVPYGSKALYQASEIWSRFGEIREMRAIRNVPFAPLEPNVDYYVCNLGTGRYINRGEAYNTQAVVGLEGLVYQLRRSSSMAEGVYYLYSEQTGKDNKVLFRTDTDGKVGEGIKACFVDGTISNKAYWKVTEVGDHIYTFEVPAKDATHVDGEYLGTSLYHETDYTYGMTYGLYWDISAESSAPENYQWAFIRVADVEAEKAFFELTEQLKQLLAVADANNIEDADEHAVYDNFDSTEPQIKAAIASLRAKLHYIDFADAHVKTICVNNWDEDGDGELSLEEALAVTDIGTHFSKSSAIKSVDELRYFLSLTSIPEGAFRSCTQLVSAYIPANVTTIGENAFYSCNSLKYIAALSPETVVAASAALPKCTIFVPANLIEAYQADELWGQSTIAEYTGVPTITTGDASRLYGKNNPKFTYELTGAPINGEPVLTCETDKTSPVGTYPIVAEPGTITTIGVKYIEGELTVEPAPLTITAGSYTRYMFEENPEFAVTYKGFVNREKADDVVLVKPTVECDATRESPAGEYEIRVFGAEAQNYEITYESGLLTVKPLGDVNGDNAIDLTDAIMIVYYSLGQEPSGFNKAMADVNGDGTTDLTDAILVVYTSLGAASDSCDPATQQMMSKRIMKNLFDMNRLQ